MVQDVLCVFSSSVLRWEKLHLVCVLMDYAAKREKLMMQKRKLENCCSGVLEQTGGN